MTPEERSRVLALAVVPGRQSLSDKEFLESFDATDGIALGLSLLNSAVESQDSVDVELALVVCFRFGFSEAHGPLLRVLACSGWHRSHEDVATALGRVGSPESVDALAYLASWVPEYLAFDAARSLATKSIWALDAIGDDASREVLKSLALSDQSVVAATARARLEK